MTHTEPTPPACQSEQGCHRVVPCDPGCKPAAEAMHARLNAAAEDRAALRDRIVGVLRAHASLGGAPPRWELPHFDGATPSLPRISGWKPLDDVADAVLAVLPASTGQPHPAALLPEAERTMLAYALDQAQEHIWSRDGFTDEDQAAVTSLRRLTAEPAAAEPADETHACPNCEGIDPDTCLMNPDRPKPPPTVGPPCIPDHSVPVPCPGCDVEEPDDDRAAGPAAGRQAQQER